MIQPNSIVCDEARAMVAEGAHLVDVRSPHEFAQDALPGAINIPLQNLLAEVHQLDHEQPVILYCRSGMRSQQAAQTLCLFGRGDVHDLGGIHNCR
jgi:rhodanese-related sulfurtransferase